MELITEVGKRENIEYKEREAARAIVYDDDNRIAVVYAEKYDYYKIPGGGLEPGEDAIDALKREVKEETGADVFIVDEIGKIIEYKNKYNQLHTSYCFSAKMFDESKETEFTDDEKALGFKVMWMTMDEAMESFERVNKDEHFGNDDHEYIARFIVKRDYEFLKKFRDDFYIEKRD